MRRAFRVASLSEHQVLYPFSPLKIIQSHADLTMHYRNPPPLKRGVRGISGGFFQGVKVIFFKKLNGYQSFSLIRGANFALEAKRNGGMTPS